MKKKSLFATKFAVVALAAGFFSPSVSVVKHETLSENAALSENGYSLNISILNTAEARGRGGRGGGQKANRSRGGNRSANRSRNTNRNVNRNTNVNVNNSRYYGGGGGYYNDNNNDAAAGLLVGMVVGAAVASSANNNSNP